MHANEIESTLKEFSPGAAPAELDARIARSLGPIETERVTALPWYSKRMRIAAAAGAFAAAAALVAMAALTTRSADPAGGTAKDFAIFGIPVQSTPMAKPVHDSANNAFVPVIEVETDHYDMGVIPNEETSSGVVMVHNRGAGLLRINRVTTSCGCTKGSMLQEVIAAGESAPLNITVDPFRIPLFDSTKTITLFTNDPKNPAVELKVSARVHPELRLVPDRLEFGAIQQGEAATQSLRVIQNSSVPLTIKNVYAAGQPGFWEITFEEIDPAEWENPEQREYLVTAHLTPDAPTGELHANLVIETEFRRIPRTTAPIVVDVKGVYSIEPAVVTLRSVSAGTIVEGVLNVWAETPIEKLEIQRGNENFTLTKRPGQRPNTYVFDVAIGQHPTERWQRDLWTVRLEAGGRVFTKDVKVMAIIDGLEPDASDRRETAN